MAILDKNRVFDGYVNLSGGMDAGRNPSLLEKTQCASADNMVFRGGVPRPRPGVRITYLEFRNPHMFYNEDGTFGGPGEEGFESSTNFQAGVFQGAVYFAPGGKPECVMAMIGGRLYQIIPRSNVTQPGFSLTLQITEIALDKTNMVTRTRAYFTQADRFCVVQDGQSKAIVFDGVTAYRSDDIPVGTIMAYGMGRLVVVAPDFRQIIFGDLYGSNALDDADPGRSVLRFTETGFLNEGGAASIAFSLGKVSGLHFVPQQDTSVGDGELLAFSEGGISTFQMALPREQWKESAFQRVVLYNVGARGWRAIVSIGEDVWFRSDDGWRSYRQARAEAGGWTHLPMSTEVRPWIEHHSQRWLEYGSAIPFDGRLLATCTPQPNNGKLFHRGLLSLDFDVLSTFGQATKPAWDGHWHAKDVRILQLVKGTFNGEERAFFFSAFESTLLGNFDPTLAFYNYVHEITKDGASDYYNQVSPEAVPIEWELVTRSMDFNEPFNENELFGGDLWVTDVKTAVNISLAYRPDQHPNWTTWQTLPEIAPVGTAQAITPGGVPTLRHNIFPRRTIEKPGNTVDAAAFTGRIMRRGYEFQVRLRGSGYCALRKLRLHDKHLVEDDKAKV
jgi:hypothetical protein